MSSTLPRVTITVTLENVPDVDQNSQIFHRQFVYDQNYYIVNFHNKKLHLPHAIKDAAEDSLRRIISYITKSWVEDGCIESKFLSPGYEGEEKYLLSDIADTNQDISTGRWDIGVGRQDAVTPTHFNQTQRRS